MLVRDGSGRFAGARPQTAAERAQVRCSATAVAGMRLRYVPSVCVERPKLATDCDVLD